MINELSTLLAELHRLRKFIRDLNAEIERGPRVLKAHQTKLQKLEESLKQAHDELKKQQVALKEKELATKTSYQQLAKYQKQSDEATEQKQIEAFKHQIDHTKQTIAGFEEESLMLMADIEARQAKIPELDAGLKKAKADFATFQEEGKERLARMQDDLKRSAAELEEREKAFVGPDKIVYDRLVKAYGADCLAPIENNSCSYCHTSVTNQKQNEIGMGKFTLCQSCGRGLYGK